LTEFRYVLEVEYAKLVGGGLKKKEKETSKMIPAPW
jgi:hypothetical protein